MTNIIDWRDRHAKAIARTQKGGEIVSETLLERPVSKPAVSNDPSASGAGSVEVVVNQELLDGADKRAGARISEFTKKLAAEWGAAPK